MAEDPGTYGGGKVGEGSLEKGVGRDGRLVEAASDMEGRKSLLLQPAVSWDTLIIIVMRGEKKKLNETIKCFPNTFTFLHHLHVCIP